MSAFSETDVVLSDYGADIPTPVLNVATAIFHLFLKKMFVFLNSLFRSRLRGVLSVTTCVKSTAVLMAPHTPRNLVCNSF